jgi:hypothetical protein
LSLSLSKILLILFFLSIVLTGADSRSEDKIPQFTDVKNKTGVRTAQTLGQTGAWGDYNNDGWLDIIISDIARRSPRQSQGSRARSRGGYQRPVPAQEEPERKPLQLLYLYASREGKTFAEVSESSGLLNVGVNAASWADYNNDSYLDIALSPIEAGKPPLLFKNSAEFEFSDVSEAAGLKEEGAVSMNVTWADYDRDGFVDLFQAGRGKSFLYRNNGDGTFTNATDKLPIDEKTSAYSATWFDANNDGYPDLFLGNSGSNKFYLNNGDGTFKNATEASGLAGEEGWRSAAACAGDYNGDGYLDLYIANLGRDARNALYKNNGDGTFTDVTEETGTGDVGDGRTCAWIDFDADGRLDIFTTNHVHPNKLYRNLGDQKFADVAKEAGIDFPKDIFSASWGDYDRDGFLDVFLNGHIGTALMKNGGNGNNSLTLKLEGNGKTTNASAIGARVEVRAPSLGLQVREVSGGKGCCEQDMLPVYFGLGGEKAVNIVVKWPGGETCKFEKTPVDKNKQFIIREAGCKLVPSR